MDEKYPNHELITHREVVGLPEEQMDNSEVGHLNIRADRIVFQELLRINNAIKDDSFHDNSVCKGKKQTYQFIGFGERWRGS